jgi:hypothetical protein
MKRKIAPKNLKPFSVMLLAGSVFLSQPVSAIGRPVASYRTTGGPGEEEPAKKAKKAKAKTFASLNNSAVKIYPDPLNRDMHVVAKDNDGKEVDFFVFDLQGTLLQNYKMKAKDHYRISGLARGTYVYRVFNGDEETASGQFEIR